MVYEALENLAKNANDVGEDGNNREFLGEVRKFLVHSTMSLASICRYDEGYFESYETPYDYDLELERNDVR